MNKIGLVLAFIIVLTIPVSGYFSKQESVVITKEYGLLQTVKDRGYLICGVNAGLPGFSAADEEGKWTGLDVDFCRAVSAAVFGDADKVEFVGFNLAQRFPTLSYRSIIVL